MATGRRVLRMVDRFLEMQKDDLLVTDGTGLMTWGEVRHHIREALRMTITNKREHKAV